MAKTVGRRSVRCPCGKTLTRRNIRTSGMAVCRCGNNFQSSDFDVFESLPAPPAGQYAWSRWDRDLGRWVACDRTSAGAIYQRLN